MVYGVFFPILLNQGRRTDGRVGPGSAKNKASQMALHIEKPPHPNDRARLFALSFSPPPPSRLTRDPTPPPFRPCARLSEEICLSEGSACLCEGSAGSLRGSVGVHEVFRG